MLLLLLDNRDSFTWNLAHAFAELGADVEVLRSDRSLAADVAARAPDRVVVGPGPGTPERAGCSLDVVRRLAGSAPVLGVCLGHQALAVAHGARLARAPLLRHGRAVAVHHRRAGLFADLPDPAWFTLYNSLVVDPDTVPDDLEVTAWTVEGEIMGLRHRTLPLEGVQFHPESILSELGVQLLARFVRGE